MNEWNNSDDSNDDFLSLKKIPKSACTRFARCHFLRLKCERKTEASILQHQFTCCFVDCSILCIITTTVLSIFSTKKTYVFHGTMESVFQSLHSEGVGAEVKHIPLITKEEEATMWEKGFDSASSGEKCILLEWEKLLDLLRTI